MERHPIFHRNEGAKPGFLRVPTQTAFRLTLYDSPPPLGSSFPPASVVSYHSSPYQLSDPLSAVWCSLAPPLKNISSWIILTSGGSRIFPRGGRQLPKVLLFFNFVPENCMKMKEFGPPGGGRASLAPPLRSANVDLLYRNAIAVTASYCKSIKDGL